MKLSKTLLALTAALSLSSAAHSAFIVNATEVGGDVLFEGSGSINTNDLALASPFPIPGGVPIMPILHPNTGVAILGNVPGPNSTEVYVGFSPSPTSFGSGGEISFDSGSGDSVGIDVDDGTLGVPVNYLSGDSLSATNQINGQTFASLGMDVGTYVWSWGSGVNADSFTLNIGGSPATIPAPLPLALLATGGLIGLSLRKKLKA